MAAPIKRSQYDVIEYLFARWPDKKAGVLASMANRYAAFRGMKCADYGHIFKIYELTGENRGSKILPKRSDANE